MSKKFFIFLFCLCLFANLGGVTASFADVEINATNFPDSNFREYIASADVSFDKNQDGKLSDEEIANVKSIYVSDSSITSLKGIEFFTALTRLECASNQLTTLDVSKNINLAYLDCQSILLTALDVSKNTALTVLLCYNNQLTTLDLSNNTALTNLSCYNQAISLDVLTTSYNSSFPYKVDFSSLSSVSDFSIRISSIDAKSSDGSAVTVSTGTDALYFSAQPSTMTYVYGTKAPSTVSGDGDMDVTVNFTSDTNTNTGSDVVTINEANFPDANFRSYVSSNFDKDSSGGLSDTEIANATEFSVNGQEISSLKGIEFFTALTRLYCTNNQLTTLDISKNTALRQLHCSENQLTALDISKNTTLEYLNCTLNQLTTLDVSKNTALTMLYCGSNQLTTLDVGTNTALRGLYCENNQLTTLDVSKNTALMTIDCFENQLTTLDISKNTALTTLSCSDNQLTVLDFSNNTSLISLYCENNQLIELDLSKNTALT